MAIVVNDYFTSFHQVINKRLRRNIILVLNFIYDNIVANAILGMR
jgi:hypothetical protein